MPDYDEELMRRFLVGDVTPDERERVEQLFQEDSAFFESLSALEEEMILEHLGNELPDPWREPFAAAVNASPARQRRVEEVRSMLRALNAPAPSITSAPLVSAAALPSAVRRRAPLLWRYTLAAALAAGVVLTGWILWRPTHAPPPPVSAGSNPDPEGAVVALLLLPGPIRSEGQASNTFRIPAGSRSLRLRIALDTPTRGAVRARLSPVGGDPIDLPGEVIVQGTEASWTVPAARLAPGDYLLSLDAAETNGPAETIARRFFSILK